MEDNMSLIEFENENDYSAIIKVVGVGGGGSNAINSMVADNIRGVEFIIANTDVQSLDKSECPGKVQIGGELTRGLGAGSNPETGRNAAEESENIIRDMLNGSDMVFITAGMGGGTGTGAAPVISRIAKETGALTVGVVTKPFPFEGKRRMKQAEEGIAELKKVVDTLIVIPNQKLLSYVGQQTSFKEAFSMVDDILKQAVCSISDLIIIPGLINLDFADVKTVMHNMGDAIMGTGIAKGQERAILAAQQAISSPLLDTQSISGAKGVIVNITAGEDMTLKELSAATKIIFEEAGKDVDLFSGYVLDKNMGDELKVTVIATGFNSKPIEQMEKSQDILRGNYNRKSEEIMEIEDTPLFRESSSNNSSTFNKNEEIDLEKDSSVVSADPKIISDGLTEVENLSYNEARLAGMFGMNILDPIAIKEILENGVSVPIVITDIRNPEKTNDFSSWAVDTIADFSHAELRHQTKVSILAGVSTMMVSTSSCEMPLSRILGTIFSKT